MTRLISAPHWVVFAIFFVSPAFLGIIGGIVFLSDFISDLAVFEETGAAPDFEGVFAFMYFALGFSMIWQILYQIWQFYIGLFLYRQVAKTAHLPYKRFVAATIFIGVYYLLMAVLGYCVVSDIIAAVNDPNFVDETDLFSALTAQALLLMVPFHLVAFLAFINNWLFLGQALKTAESPKDWRLGDYLAEAIFFWIWPIGVWFFQPRLQNIAAQNSEKIGN